MSCCLDEIAAADQAIMREELLRSGYCDVDAIIRDEMQAYMAGNNNLLGADAVVAPWRSGSVASLTRTEQAASAS